MIILEGVEGSQKGKRHQSQWSRLSLAGTAPAMGWQGNPGELERAAGLDGQTRPSSQGRGRGSGDIVWQLSHHPACLTLVFSASITRGKHNLM